MGGGFTRVPTVLSGNPAIMELDFDRFGGNRQSLGHLEVPVRSVVEGGNRVPIPAVVTTR